MTRDGDRAHRPLRRSGSEWPHHGAANGVSERVAERVWDQIKGFSGFGFPKAHSAAFGLLAYQSAWLRIHYGPEFLCSLLNEQPMGFYPPDSLVHEAQRRGIRVAPPCANRCLIAAAKNTTTTAPITAARTSLMRAVVRMPCRFRNVNRRAKKTIQTCEL